MLGSKTSSPCQQQRRYPGKDLPFCAIYFRITLILTNPLEDL